MLKCIKTFNQKNCLIRLDFMRIDKYKLEFFFVNYNILISVLLVFFVIGFEHKNLFYT